MKIFEYMAIKKPMICSKLNAIEEILQHNHNALLLPASDEQKWAEAIDMLCESPDIAKNLGANAYQSLADHYTWDKRVEAIFDFYNRQRHQATHWKMAAG